MKRVAASATAILGVVVFFTARVLAQADSSTAPPRSNLSTVSGTKNPVNAKSLPQKALTVQRHKEVPGLKEIRHPEENVVIPGLPHPVPGEGRAVAPNAVDVRPLWALFKLRKLRLLEQRIAVLKKYYPGWKPPVALDALLHIEKAALTKNDREMLAAHAQWPEFFSCAQVDNLWKLADAEIRMGHAEDGLSVYKKILATCTSENDRLLTLARASGQFSPDQIEDLIKAEGLRRLGENATKSYDDIRYHFYVRWLYDAVKAQRWKAASHAAAAIADDVKARHDADAAAAIGWLNLKGGRAAGAVPWFEASFAWKPTSANTALGLALSLRASGKNAAAYAIASRFPHHQQLTDLRKDILAQRVQSAFQAGKYDEVLRLTDQCDRLGSLRNDVALYEGWAHYQKSDARTAEAIFERMYRQTRDGPAAVGLIFSLMRLKRYRRALDLSAELPGALTDILEPEKAKGNRTRAVTTPAVGLGASTVPPDTRYLFFSSWLYDAINERNYKTADWIVQKIQSEVRAKHSDRLDASIGWVEINLKKYGPAAVWFKAAIADATPMWPGIEDAAYGLALAQLKAGEYEAAAKTARAWSGRFARLRRFYGEVLMEQAREEYNQKNYRESLELARLAVRALPGRREPKMLEAWSHYHLGDFDQAKTEFESLYRAQTDRESAAGLAYALQREGNLSLLQTLAQSLHGPLQSIGTRIVAEQYYNTNQFLRAADLAPRQFPDLEGISSPALGVGFTFWSISGSPGLSRLNGFAEPIEAQAIAGLNRFSLKIDILQLDAGNITPAQMVNAVGTVRPGKPARFSPTTELLNGIEPMIGWSREGEISPFVQIGLTPANGEVSPTVIGNAGVGFLYDSTTTSISFIRQPISQSLLSFTGIRDPATGTTFGRVVETEGHIDIFHQFGPHWGATITGTAGEITAHNVADNSDLSGSAGFDYSINPEYFKYIAVGPSYQYETFQHNLSSFTFGNGGYYSPQYFHRVGLAANFQSREASRLLIKGTTFVGWQTAMEEAAPLYPLNDSRVFTPAISSTGPNDFVAIQAAYLLGSHWILQTNVSYLASPQYNFIAVGLQIRFSLEPRKKLLSADLWRPIETTPVPMVP